MRPVSQLIYLFNRQLIYFVVNIQTLDVLPISFDRVNQVVNIVVASEHYLSIVDFVLMHDILDHFFINFSQLYCGVEYHTSCLLGCYLDIWLLLVKLNPHCLKLPCKFQSLLFSLLTIQHHQN